MEKPNSRRRLTREQRQEIKRLASAGGLLHKEIAYMFNVSIWTIRNVVNNPWRDMDI